MTTPISNSQLNNPWSDPNIDWYNQFMAPSMDYVSDIYDQAMDQLTNFGFNEDNRSTETNKRALEELQEMAPKLDTADKPYLGQDGRFSRGDMEAALNDTSGTFSDEEKAVIKYILNVQQNNDPNSTLWNAMDRGGTVSQDAVQAALSRDLAPDAATMHDDGLVA